MSATYIGVDREHRITLGAEVLPLHSDTEPQDRLGHYWLGEGVVVPAQPYWSNRTARSIPARQSAIRGDA